MPVTQSHHGSRVTQSDEDLVFATVGNTAVVGILGTAPDADADDWPYNVPKMATNPTQLSTLGDAGTLKFNLDTIFDWGGTIVVVVRIEEGATAAELLANAVGDFTTLTGIHAFKKATSLGLPKPKLLLAPGISTINPNDGIASVSVTSAGANYDAETVLTIEGATGTGAEIAPIIGAGGTLDGVKIIKPGYGYTGPLVVTPSNQGDGAGAVFAGTIGAVLNPITAEAIGITNTLNAMFYADGPDGTDEQAIQARQLIGSKRVFYCDPRALKSANGVTVPAPSSAVFVGCQAYADKNFGPHYAGSNFPIPGIIGTNRAVIPGDQANNLNFNRVNTIVNHGDGFRTWGVWTCSQDSIWQFVSVVRTTDAVNEAIERAFLEFTDRPMNRANLDLMVWSGLQSLKTFENDGMLLPGSTFKASALNTPSSGVAGIIKFVMAFEVPAPMVDIRIGAFRNIEVAYTLLFNSVTGEISIEQASSL